ncbi:hypothetical protein [Thiomicrorhabdus sp.]|uniref:hypothetical protein n=1 Tax=Thiomicrorhabdus sp. TaxID=2039724 RepID=UPI002AA8235F|nr:hypothetical protein [Thiomicrorhabdus sp.]
MKKLTTLVTAIVLSSASFAVLADSHMYGKGDKKCHHDSKQYYQKLSLAERQAKMENRINFKVERMAKRLDLTKKQQHKLKQILKNKAEKKRELYKETKQQIHNILNPEQIKKMKRFKKA